MAPPRRKSYQLSEFEKGQIVAFKKAGYKSGQIAKELRVNPKTIRNCFKKLKKQGNLNRVKKRVYKRITTEVEDGALATTARRHPKSTARHIADLALGEERSLKLGVDTIRRRLSEKDLHCRKIARKPYLNDKHFGMRLDFARKYLHWTSEDWSKVLFSDESKFNLFGSDGGQKTCYRRKGQRFDSEFLTPTVKHGGGSVFVWGCFSFKGVGQLRQVAMGQSMNAAEYVQVLSDSMVESAYQLFGEGDFIFQQDNDPKHTSKLVKNWFSNPQYELSDGRQIGNFTLLDWPSNSPDLNPIENLWAILDRERNKLVKKPTRIAELMASLREAWEKIDRATLMKLIESMPKRCEAVIKAKGGHTKW